LPFEIPFGSYALDEPARSPSKLVADSRESRTRHLERMIVRGNFAYQMITATDAEYHSMIFRGDDPIPEVEGTIIACYERWLAPSDGLLAKIGAMEAEGGEVEGADEYRANVRAARGVFMGDPEFFDLGAMAELADRAVEDHREGRTVEFDGPGQ